MAGGLERHGGLEEKNFAKTHPTITIEGCSESCAKIAVERYSGLPAATFYVDDIIKEFPDFKPKSREDLGEDGMKIAEYLAKRVARRVEELYEQQISPPITISCQESACKFIQALPKGELYILIDIKKTQEGCVFGVEVDVKILKNKPEEALVSDVVEVAEIPTRLFYVSKEFLCYFNKYHYLKLELKGKFRKKIVCTNIPPFVTKTCGCNLG